MINKQKKGVNGIILAGGRGLRLGTDKGTALLNGKPLIEYVIRNMAPLCDEILVSSNSNQHQIYRLRGHFHDQRTLDFEVFHDFLPNAGTWMELDPEVEDRWGLPVARIHLDLPEHHKVAGRWLAERSLDILEDLGADDLYLSDVGGTSSYLVHGTCRAGTDPNISVLDEHCRAHEVPNLYVVDGSFMPTSGGAAPTLTILANSFRVADQMVVRFRKGDLG